MESYLTFLGACSVAIIGFFLKAVYRQIEKGTASLTIIQTQIEVIKIKLEDHAEAFDRVTKRTEQNELDIKMLNGILHDLKSNLNICQALNAKR